MGKYKNIQFKLHRNHTKVFLFLAPKKGLRKFETWETRWRWMIVMIPFLFTLQIYWDIYD